MTTGNRRPGNTMPTNRCPGTRAAGPLRARYSGTRGRHQRGFSLLEVIAAMLLLAIAFSVLMKVAGGSIHLTQNAAAHGEAAMWARSMLDSAYVMEPVTAGSRSGRFNKTFSWRLQVTPWQQIAAAPSAPLRLYQLDLEVMWGPSAHPRSAHFRTLRLAGPAQPGPSAGLSR